MPPPPPPPRLQLQLLKNITKTQLPRYFSTTIAAMGVEKVITQEGTGRTPKNGDTVTMQYTGYLREGKETGQWNKGFQFDSSVGKRDFVTKIGVGQVIKGWDEGVVQMKVGEKATLQISSDFAYNDRGFPDLIPAHSDLIFDVELKKID